MMNVTQFLKQTRVNIATGTLLTLEGMVTLLLSAGMAGLCLAGVFQPVEMSLVWLGLGAIGLAGLIWSRQRDAQVVQSTSSALYLTHFMRARILSKDLRVLGRAALDQRDNVVQEFLSAFGDMPASQVMLESDAWLLQAFQLIKKLDNMQAAGARTADGQRTLLEQGAQARERIDVAMTQLEDMRRQIRRQGAHKHTRTEMFANSLSTLARHARSMEQANFVTEPAARR